MFDQAVQLLEQDNDYEIIEHNDNQIVFENDKKQRYITIRKIFSSYDSVQVIVDSEDYFYDKSVTDLKIIERLKNV